MVGELDSWQSIQESLFLNKLYIIVESLTKGMRWGWGICDARQSTNESPRWDPARRGGDSRAGGGGWGRCHLQSQPATRPHRGSGFEAPSWEETATDSNTQTSLKFFPSVVVLLRWQTGGPDARRAVRRVRHQRAAPGGPRGDRLQHRECGILRHVFSSQGSLQHPRFPLQQTRLFLWRHR